MFDEHPLSERLEAQEKLIVEWVTRLSDAKLLSDSADELAREVMARFELHVPELLPDQMVLDEAGSGNTVDVLVPFSGHPELFRYWPSHYEPGNPPQGNVIDEEVVITLGYSSDLQPEGRRRADEALAVIQDYLGWANSELGLWRYRLEEKLRRLIRERAEVAKVHRETMGNIGIPIRPRADAPRMYRGPGIERLRPWVPPGAPPLPEEAALPKDYYEHILFVIRAAGKAMERSPNTYEGWSEPQRRDVLVLMLNTHYRGMTQAEAFNGRGHTDILIRSNDENVFIAECKFFKGAASVTKTVDQLFAYTTVRDVKLAVVLFIPRVDFTAAVATARQALEAHERFRAWLHVENAPETELRAQMAWPDDDQHLVTLHVSAFCTPLPKDDMGTGRADAEDGDGDS
jgi:hypothetical protein